MKTSRTILLTLFISFCFFTGAFAQKQKEVMSGFKKLPLTFTKISSKAGAPAKYISNGAGTMMNFSKKGASFILTKETEASKKARESMSGKNADIRNDDESNIDLKIEKESFGLNFEFKGVNPDMEIIGEELKPAFSNYFYGKDPAGWRTGEENYSKMRMKNVYDGVDVVYSGDRSRLNYTIEIKPGTDPEIVKLKYNFSDNSPQNRLYVNQDGGLTAVTPLGEIANKKPVCYQIINGEKVELDVEYKISGTGLDEVSFSVKNHEPGFTVFTEDEFVFGGPFGGTGVIEAAFDIALDDSGYIYLTGMTSSSDFLVTDAAYDTSFNGGSFYMEFFGLLAPVSIPDVFVIKLDPTGKNVVFSTYLGGTGWDDGYKMAVDGSGNIYVTGMTGSSNFPVTSGAFDETFNGAAEDSMWAEDIFVTKLSVDGGSLVYSTYIGGSKDDSSPEGLYVNESGEAYLTIDTYSRDFPVTSGAYDESHNAPEGKSYRDIAVVKLNSSGTGLVYSTFIGGAKSEYTGDIEVDPQGNAFVTGFTYSPDFPTTTGVYGDSIKGASDIFVVKLNPSGDSLVYSTLIGGSGYDKAEEIEIDAQGNAFIAGYTKSDAFPVVGTAYSNKTGRYYDAAVVKLNVDGTDILYSTKIGGSGYDKAYALKVDNNENVYIGGYSSSSNFPVTPGAIEGGNPGSAFFLKLNTVTGNLKYSTFLGRECEEVTGIEIKDNYAYITGYTEMPFLPFDLGGMFKHEGWGEAFFYKIELTSFGDIFGRVYDSETGELVEDVTVELRQTGYEHLSDTSGIFGMADCRPGEYTLAFSKPGYYTNKPDTIITVTKGGVAIFNAQITKIVPEAEIIFVTPNPTAGLDSVMVYAKAALPDEYSSSKTVSRLYIKEAECFIGADPGAGNGIPLNTIDTRFNEDVEALYNKIGVGDLTDGTYTLAVRVKHNAGLWSDTTTIQLVKSMFSGGTGGAVSYIGNTSLNMATERSVYTDTLEVINPVGSLTFQIIEGPKWLTVDNNGVLSGTPTYEDVSEDIPVAIHLVNQDGLMDMATLKITVTKKTSTMNTVNEITVLSDSAVINQWFNDDSYVRVSFMSGVVEGKTLKVRKTRNIKQVYPQIKNFDLNLGYYELSTDAESFSAEVIFNYTEDALLESGLGTEDLIVLAIDSSSTAGYVWKEVISEIDANAKTITFSSSEFSIYAVTSKYEEYVTGIEDEITGIPERFGLHQNYPNPFNPETTIKYQLPKSAFVNLKIYNLLGQEVRSLVSRDMSAGFQTVKWDGRNNSGIKVNSGMYIYKISAGDFAEVKKMVMLK